MDLREFIDEETYFEYTKAATPTQFIRVLTEELFQQAKVKYPEVDEDDIDDVIDDFIPVLMEEYAERDKAGKGIDADISIEEEQRIILGKTISPLFRDIQYDGKEITLETLLGKMNANKISVKNPLDSDGKARKGPTKIKERVQTFSNDASHSTAFGLMSKYPNIDDNIEVILDGLKKYYASITRRGLGSQIPRIAIKDDVRKLMGYYPKLSLSEKERIYSYWAEVAELHSEVVEAGKEIKGEDFQKALMAFKTKGQYVVKFSPVDVIDEDDEITAIKLLATYVNARNDGHIDIDGLSGIVEDAKGDVSLPKNMKKADVLSAYLFDILGGVFVTNKQSLDAVLEIFHEYKEIILKEEDVEDIDDFLSDLEEIEVYSQDHHLPVHILNKNNINNLFGRQSVTIDSIKNIEDYAKFKMPVVNDAIERLIEETLKVANITAFRSGQSVTAPKYYEEEGEKRATYGAIFPSRKVGGGEELSTTITKFIEALTAYLVKPTLKKKMSLGISYGFTDGNAFKTIVTLSNNPSALATKAIYTSAQRRPMGALFNNSDLTNILNFLRLLMSHDKTYEDIHKSANSVTTTMHKVFKDKEVVKNTNEEMAAFMGSIAKTMGYSKAANFKGYDPIKTHDKLATNELDEITSFDVMKNFIVDNKDSIKAGRTKIDEIVRLFNELTKTSGVHRRILEAHDGLRILKGMPTYYGKCSIYCVDSMDYMINKMSNEFSVDLTSGEIVRVVDDLDSYGNIAKSIGISEENVYFIKANFR